MKLKSFCIILLSINSLSASAEVILDATLGHGGALRGADYLISADLGRHQGDNLFHSFQEFNLNRFESATFSGPNSVNNIISRVTGGNPSNIDGLIRSTISNADMYFLNPYGIVFGPNAQLDVQGSFHASTADYLRLKDGGRFDARNPNNSLLTIAPIESFGFLNVAPISIQGHGEVTQNWAKNRSTGLNVPEGKTLSLIGGKIDIWMGTFFKTMTLNDEGNESPEINRLPILSAPSGRINLASVASQGEVKLGKDFVDVSSFSNLADIHLTKKSSIATSGEGGGNIFIRGGQFFADDSTIEAKTLGSKNGGVIDIRTNAISLTNGAILNGNTESTGKGSSIYLQATESITIAGEAHDFPNNPDYFQRSGIFTDSGIYQELTDENLGNTGNINLEAKNILFEDGARVSMNTHGGGQGGDITLRASESVSVIGETSDKIGTAITVMTSNENYYGNAGKLSIEAQNISFIDGALINSTTIGKGKGGDVTLKASDTVAFEGESSNREGSSISLQTQYEEEGAGDGGSLLINASNISFSDGAYIDLTTFGKGNSGNVTLKASDTVELKGESSNGEGSNISLQVQYEEEGAGNGGTLLIEANNISIINGAYIDSTAYGRGKGGSVALKASDTVVFKGESSEGTSSRVYLQTQYEEEGAGDSGTLLIDANNILFSGGAYIDLTTFGKGNSGNVTLKASDVVFEGEASNGKGSNVSLQTQYEEEGAGNGGTILIEANDISISDGAYIDSTTYGKGNAGTATLHINNMLKLTGVGKEGSGSQISVSADVDSTGGNAGNIVVKAQNVLLNDGGKIESTSFGLGKAGNVHIHATDTITIAGVSKEGWHSTIASGSNPKKEGIIGGEGGHITIEADQLIIKNGGGIAASSIAPKGIQSSRGGNIAIRVQGAIELSGVNPYGENEDGFGSGIYARSLGKNAGAGGKIELSAGSLTITEGAIIESSTNNNASSGNIKIDVSGPVRISGDASQIELLAPASSQKEYRETFSPTLFDQSISGIYANSKSISDQAGKGGSIAFSAKNMDLTHKGKISASSAGGGDGGQIVVNIDKLQLADQSEITTASVSSGGKGNAGTIKINASDILLNGSYISSDTSGKGSAGQVWVTAKNNITVEKGSYIASGTVGEPPDNIGNADKVIIKASELLVTTLAGIYSNTKNKGNAGKISIEVNNLLIDKGGRIYTSTEDTGNAGNIDIHAANSITITGSNADIASTIESASKPIATNIGGKGGNITLTVPNFTLTDSGTVSASSTGEGDAGQIVINVEKLQLANNTGITTASSKSGGGSITINAEGVIFLFKEDQISTSVHKGAGNGGNLTISEPQFIVVNKGEIIAQADDGNGGNINLKSNHFWVSSDSIINASSKTGLDGRVNVDSPDMNMDLEIVVVLPDGFLRDNQLQSPCASRIAENKNYFFLIPSEGTSNAVTDLFPSGLSLSQIKPIKITKSMKGTMMEKQAVKVALLAGCQPNLSAPPVRVRKTATRKSSVIPEEPLF